MLNASGAAYKAAALQQGDTARGIGLDQYKGALAEGEAAQAIGRLVDVTASPEVVTVRCDGQVIACHPRSWAKNALVTDPAHQAAAAAMRQSLALDRAARERARRHSGGHPVVLRALPDYDALFGVDFTPATT